MGPAGVRNMSQFSRQHMKIMGLPWLAAELKAVHKFHNGPKAVGRPALQKCNLNLLATQQNSSVCSLKEVFMQISVYPQQSP
jgi:hypothetical protein